jgi:2,3-bisphosphoglycerate-independent phosphoglycerate mutase
MIFDGLGVNPSRLDNGWYHADTPNLDYYFAHNPHTVLQASGLAVGLPDGQFGNSEVGHLTLGSGRILEQDLLRIAEAINDGELEDHPAWKTMLDGTKRVHLVGLVSDGGVHSHIAHLLEMLRMITEAGVEPIVHMITDGRDAAPRSALSYLQQVEDKIEELGSGKIATVAGRYWAMDRARNYDRTEKAWRAMIHGDGEKAKTPTDAIKNAYNNDTTDEFILPTVIGDNPTLIMEDEPILFFNFRSDRASQLAAALGLPEFTEFDRDASSIRKLICVTQYSKNYPFSVLFPTIDHQDILAEVISNAGLKQFHCAETEKFPHVTYFFNGGKEEPFPGEDREMIPSLSVETYDLKPEMSSEKVADRVIEAIESKQYDFILVNFANGDMVGHTAKMEPIIKAIETLDAQGDRVIRAAKKQNFTVLLTADHGNCDEVVDPSTRQHHTQHSVYPVPFLIIGQPDAKLGIGRGLADVAPTVLDLLGLSKPLRMTGRSLILKQALEF